jgi:hypothetical protein
MSIVRYELHGEMHLELFVEKISKKGVRLRVLGDDAVVLREGETCTLTLPFDFAQSAAGGK